MRVKLHSTLLWRIHDYIIASGGQRDACGPDFFMPNAFYRLGDNKIAEGTASAKVRQVVRTKITCKLLKNSYMCEQVAIMLQ